MCQSGALPREYPHLRTSISLILDAPVPAKNGPGPVTCLPPYSVYDLSGSVERHLATYFATFDDLPPAGLYHRILREIETPLLSAALTATRGNQIRAAELLGLNRNTLRKKIRDLDIQVYRGSRA